MLKIKLIISKLIDYTMNQAIIENIHNLVHSVEIHQNYTFIFTNYNAILKQDKELKKTIKNICQGDFEQSMMI